MRSTVAKWGNSLAVRIPRTLAAEAALGEGAEVELRVEEGSLVIAPAKPRYRLADLLSEFKPEHRRAEEDWGRPVGEEAW